MPWAHVGACEVRGTGGFYEWDEVPVDPWSEVTPNIWVGSALRAQPAPGDFDYVVTLWRRALPVVGGTEVSWFFPDSVAPNEDTLHGVARELNSRSKWGQRCLVRCQLGLNRSAFVAAATLVSMGDEPAAAVAQVREARPGALRNPNFVEALDAVDHYFKGVTNT